MNGISQFSTSLVSTLSHLNFEAAKPIVSLFIQRTRDLAIYYATPPAISLGTGLFIGVAVPLATVGISLGITYKMYIDYRGYKNYPSLTDLLPNWTWRCMEVAAIPGDILLQTINKVMVTCLPFLENTKLEMILFYDFIGPVVEELEWRWFVQEVCLKVAPNLLINALAPGYGSLVYHPAAKVCRVVISAGLFALAHTDHWGEGKNKNAGIMSHFIGGLAYGGLTEYYRGSIFYSSVSHAAHNFAINFFSLVL